MKLAVPPGRYVVAVSGGVDSVVLLNLLSTLPGVRLTVAHFDHGIRKDSRADRLLVQELAQEYRLPFVYHQGNLGEGASEDVARRERYDFLHTVRVAAKASAVITAHHQDDMLETAIINVLRGTGRRGLSSLKNRDTIIRPLLGFEKDQIISYATSHELAWHEDSTNQDQAYLRNYVRQSILAKFSPAQKQQLLKHIQVAAELNDQLEGMLVNQLHIQPSTHKLDRHWFVQLPHGVAREVLATWFRERGVVFDKKTLERLVVAAKTFTPGKTADVNGGYSMQVTTYHLALTRRDR